MEGYQGSIELIGSLIQKNGNNSFPLLNTELIQAKPDGTRLDEYLNELSVSGGSVDVDSAFSDTSTNPVENKVITEALNNKQDLLIAGNNITIEPDGTISAADVTGTINVKITENLDNTDDVYKLDITQFNNTTQTTTTTTTPNLKGHEGIDGVDGKDVLIVENANNNDDTYKLDITKWNKDSQAYETITTPNLIGASLTNIVENADNTDIIYKLDVSSYNKTTGTYKTTTSPNLKGTNATIEENASNTDTVYKLDITSFDESTGAYTTVTTPNLKQLIIPTSRPSTLVNGTIWVE